MAAPTVGAVMSDILPYLGVSRSFPEDDPAGKTVVLEDYEGLTAEEVQKQLKSLGITAKLIGNGDTVTGQIPAAGQSVPGSSQILLYLGEEPVQQQVEVPNFKGMNRKQASDLAESLGLYVLMTGNQDNAATVTVQRQSIDPGAKIEIGTTIELEFVDTKVSD